MTNEAEVQGDAGPVPVDPWGRFAVPVGTERRWQIGPMSLHVQRLQREWRLLHEQGDDPLDERTGVEPATARAIAEDDPDVERYATHLEGEALDVLPRLADRTVIARPDRPFHLLAGARLELYVSTPLWVALEFGGTLLRELPVYRPPDTWFGATTTVGEICYASRTAARLDLAEVAMRPGRAVTPVTMVNASSEALRVERFAIPVHTLRLYRDAQGSFWTQGVTLEREARGTGRVVFANGAPAAAEGGTRVADCRVSQSVGFSRALEALFG